MDGQTFRYSTSSGKHTRWEFHSCLTINQADLVFPSSLLHNDIYISLVFRDYGWSWSVCRIRCSSAVCHRSSFVCADLLFVPCSSFFHPILSFLLQTFFFSDADDEEFKKKTSECFMIKRGTVPMLRSPLCSSIVFRLTDCHLFLFYANRVLFHLQKIIWLTQIVHQTIPGLYMVVCAMSVIYPWIDFQWDVCLTLHYSDRCCEPASGIDEVWEQA